MCIKVQYSDWSTIDFIECSKGWQSYAMIPAKGKQFRFWICRVVESWNTRTEFKKGRCHLVEREGIIKRRNRDVTTIKNCIR